MSLENKAGRSPLKKQEENRCLKKGQKMCASGIGAEVVARKNWEESNWKKRGKEALYSAETEIM